MYGYPHANQGFQPHMYQEHPTAPTPQPTVQVQQFPSHHAPQKFNPNAHEYGWPGCPTVPLPPAQPPAPKPHRSSKGHKSSSTSSSLRAVPKWLPVTIKDKNGVCIPNHGGYHGAPLLDYPMETCTRKMKELEKNIRKAIERLGAACTAMSTATDVRTADENLAKMQSLADEIKCECEVWALTKSFLVNMVESKP